MDIEVGRRLSLAGGQLHDGGLSDGLAGMTSTFDGQLNVESNGDGYVIAPESVVAELGGGRARIPIVGSVLGHEFRSSTRPMGDGRHGIRVYKAVRQRHGLRAGDRVRVRVEREPIR